VRESMDLAFVGVAALVRGAADGRTIVPGMLLLASDRASYIRGQTLLVSGSYTMM
jgi:NAD(P)-dependent dehydrogenase (short-subunit alcohol dehydrogenase family)